jgi:hypothetical protein
MFAECSSGMQLVPAEPLVGGAGLCSRTCKGNWVPPFRKKSTKLILNGGVVVQQVAHTRLILPYYESIEKIV